ncbi:AGC/YANK protein kinase [Allomyces macrogynus ATCC 38327]|uniref:AGC/YANK protein kinase n=1 Tax=Allomyces macrogynus (strain ATCC 38327) TaxID=578462 RepID=A0A0L0T5K6_ALLM3|nr:AGC/YANK protein kinase [Allomyces macrogynus ATCC 38327]|eukprot:KNE69859.1 AGC/YANK protein kinase [Allomyces macrogynus ATCC 38327]
MSIPQPHAPTRADDDLAALYADPRLAAFWTAYEDPDPHFRKAHALAKISLLRNGHFAVWEARVRALLQLAVDLNHFELLRSVGKGAFGKVRVVQHKRDKTLYALKYINKEKCIKMRAVENIIQERRLLEEIHFPLIVNLRFAFQDDENLFMVLDLMLGGDLRFHLDRQGCLNETAVQFYVAEIALALNYLHERKIVHRDLKPDNVLLCERGHAHLTDFNIAVHYNDRKPLTAIAGSMAYMAPEVGNLVCLCGVEGGIL